MKKLLDDGSEGAPRFNLSVENEILRIKLKAEFGAECWIGKKDNIPEKVVHEFLKSVYEFEQKFRRPGALRRVYDHIGQPDFVKEDLLDDKQVSEELQRMHTCLEKHYLQLIVIGDYPERMIYKFITEEFFYVEIEDPGVREFRQVFCYEDFYPDYNVELRKVIIDFLSEWFSKRIDEYNLHLNCPFLLPDGRQLNRSKVISKIRRMYDAYFKFHNCQYRIDHLEFERNQQCQAGRGHVRGQVRYDAQLENGEIIHIEGPYEFDLIDFDNWWNIQYFEFPGFRWDE